MLGDVAPRPVCLIQPSERELLRLLAADVTAQRLAARALAAVNVVVLAAALLVATHVGSCP